jgi:hypothetical protein
MNEAYRRSLSYWYPDRRPGTVDYVQRKREGDRPFDVVRITPQGGRPYDLWIDAATSLPDRSVEQGGIETRTTFFSDYDDFGGVRMARSIRSTNGETAYDLNITVLSVETNVALDDAAFQVPGPPPPDFSFPEGAASIEVPFQLINNHLYVDILLNGEGRFKVICDTGGQNVVTPTLAGRLGLKPEGALQGRGVGEKSEDVGLVKIETLQLGGLTLHDQLFAVFPLESFSDVEGVEQFGLVGYEIFKRFTVTVDYEHGRLTLTRPEAFQRSEKATAVPFRFHEIIPQVDGSIDGIPGAFDLDTGSRVSLSLMRPFVETHGLKERYRPKYEGVTGWGVGGAARTAAVRASELRLGDVVIREPVTELTLQQKGALTDRYAAGNVGAGVLKQFTVTFDYARQVVLFEPNALYGQADPFDRSGMWINRKGDAFEIMDVAAGGPAAAAGLAVGDRILAVDGSPTAKLFLPDLRTRLKTEPAGTVVRLQVARGDSEREVSLTLRDLL